MTNIVKLLFQAQNFNILVIERHPVVFSLLRNKCFNIIQEFLYNEPDSVVLGYTYLETTTLVVLPANKICNPTVVLLYNVMHVDGALRDENQNNG